MVKKRIRLLFTLLAVLVLSASCSSAPKKPKEIFTERNTLAGQLDLAVKTANQGNFKDALASVEYVNKKSVSLDSPHLIVRSSIVMGNILFAIDRYDEAFAQWDRGIEAAVRDKEKNLESEARIYRARGSLLLPDKNNVNIEEIKTMLNREINSLKDDPAAQAAGYAVLGLAEKEQRRYAEAEAALRKALAIHEKQLFLEDAAYDWFIIASVYSVNQKYSDAVNALNNAITLDRKAENGFGLASSWRALGDVFIKSGNTAEAASAYRRSADIYNALGMEKNAMESMSKIREN